VDVSRQCIRSLEVLRLPVDQWDAHLYYVLSVKMDPDSKILWEQSLQNSSIPLLKSLFDFLEQRARALSTRDEESTKGKFNKVSVTNNIQQHKSRGSSNVHHASSSKCLFCNESNHFYFKCQTCLQWSQAQRSEAVKKHGLCYNCIKSGHGVSQCPSAKSCKTCGSKHHTFLHRETVPQGTVPATSKSNTESTSYHSMKHTPPNFDTILATALISVMDQHGQLHPCRAFLDNGSNSYFVTESFVRKLGVKKIHQPTHSTGLGGQPVCSSSGYTELSIRSRFDNNYSYDIIPLIVKKISNSLPMFDHDPSKWPHLQDLPLADPMWHRPQQVDMLLGADIFFSILREGKKTGLINGPIAINTEFGWLVGGGTHSVTSHNQSVVNITNSRDSSLIQALERFWEIEDIPAVKILTQEEQSCENHFKSTYNRSTDGRFILKLPFKPTHLPLGNSFHTAQKQLHALEKRLATQVSKKDEYIKFMREYESLGHMQEIAASTSESDCKSTYYIRHHMVTKETSSTTKYRVVFNASSKTFKGPFLNETLMVGPTIQDPLVDILLSFRLHKYVFTADIAKMYRQIQVAPEDLSYQRILWRESSSLPIKHYQLNTVTYGTAPVPRFTTPQFSLFTFHAAFSKKCKVKSWSVSPKKQTPNNFTPHN